MSDTEAPQLVDESTLNQEEQSDTAINLEEELGIDSQDARQMIIPPPRSLPQDGVYVIAWRAMPRPGILPRRMVVATLPDMETEDDSPQNIPVLAELTMGVLPKKCRVRLLESFGDVSVYSPNFLAVSLLFDAYITLGTVE
jgi:hypothetical protein